MLPLGLLSRSETSELVAAVIGCRRSRRKWSLPQRLRETSESAALAAAIHARSEGQPIYIQRIVQWLQERAEEEGRGGEVLPLGSRSMRFVMARELPSMNKLMTRGADHLPTEHQMTLRVAAVLGSVNLSAFLLAAVHPKGNFTLRDVMGHLRSLEDAGMLSAIELGDGEVALGAPGCAALSTCNGRQSGRSRKSDATEGAEPTTPGARTL